MYILAVIQKYMRFKPEDTGTLKVRDEVSKVMEVWANTLKSRPSTRDMQTDLSQDRTLLTITGKDIHLRIQVSHEANIEAPFSYYAFNSKDDLLAAQNPKVSGHKNREEIESLLGI